MKWDGIGGHRIGKRTRQITLPHLRQSLTRSLAQADTFPETKCPASPSMCHFCPGSSLSVGLASRNSFSQRRVCCTRRVRYCKRLARIWRHVRDRASRVFRSTLWARLVMMLGWELSVYCDEIEIYLCRKEDWEAGGRTDRRPRLQRSC